MTEPDLSPTNAARTVAEKLTRRVAAAAAYALAGAVAKAEALRGRRFERVIFDDDLCSDGAPEAAFASVRVPWHWIGAWTEDLPAERNHGVTERAVRVDLCGWRAEAFLALRVG